MGQRRTKGKSLKRSTSKRPELRTVLVFCEGVNSEPDYINALKRVPEIADNTTLNVLIYPKQGVPLTLVQMAVAEGGDPEIDERWCIFDVEWPRNHPNLDKAIRLAEANNVHLAISNPCFELWLILHHQDFAKFESTEAVERHSRRLDGRTGKSIDADLYMPLRDVAIDRAERLSSRHEQDGTIFPHDNPSSGMHRFVRALDRK